MSEHAESKIIDGNIAYFLFKKEAGPDTFTEIFPDFQQKVADPKIDRMIVDVQMDNAWGKSIQELWLQTGKTANDAGIKRWGVVTAEPKKQMTIEFLIKGGKEGGRDYETYVAQSLDEVLEWIRK